MLFWTTLKVAVRSLLANKLRAILSMLGIIIGVGAVIAMLAVGAGAREQVMSRITAMGSNLIMVSPAQSAGGGVRGGSAQTLTLEDAQALLNTIDGVNMASPVVRGNAQFKYYNANMQSSIMGVTLTYLDIRNYEIDHGRSFTVGEVERSAQVAVLGSDTVTELFGDLDPVGEEISIAGKSFLVLGVLKSKGSQGPFNQDDLALIPYTTAMNRILGVDHLDEVDLQIGEDADQTTIEDRIASLLRSRHRLRPEEEDDFRVRNMAEVIETAASVTGTFSLLLGSVAAISLVVGGIGIMNIMLVTVTERTREIGIRKAIGARERDVLIQFLLESMLMSSLGGVIGVVMGLGTAVLIARFASFPALVQPGSVTMAFSFAVGVGVFFGYYPARRAAAMDPIEALSYE
jgi:putative ABC transport system permease protein